MNLNDCMQLNVRYMGEREAGRYTHEWPSCALVPRRHMFDDLSVAIVTLWDGSHAYACSLLHWCQHAQRLADTLRSISTRPAELMLLLTSADTSDFAHGQINSDCPQLRIVTPPAALAYAVSAFAKVGCQHRRSCFTRTSHHSTTHMCTVLGCKPTEIGLRNPCVCARRARRW